MSDKVGIDLGVLEDDGMKVEGGKEFVHESMSPEQIRVRRVEYILQRIREKRINEPMVTRFVRFVEEAVVKARTIDEPIGEGIARHAEALFLSVQPGFNLTKEQRDKIRELCKENGVFVPDESENDF